VRGKKATVTAAQKDFVEDVAERGGQAITFVGLPLVVLAEKFGFQLFELLGEPFYFGPRLICRERPPGFANREIDRRHLPQ